MRSQMVRTVLAVIFVLSAQVCVLAAEDANSLYQQAYGLEREGKFADAMALYSRVCTEFAGDPFAGPDKAGYRVKYIACNRALKNGDMAAAKKIAEEIRVLPCSAEQKPYQLYWTGRLFEGKGLFADALAFYNQVMAEYPKALESGPDKAGFYVKYIACKMALKNGDIAAAKKIAEEIRVLPCSAEQKPSQLYEIGRLFEGKNLFADALTFYNPVMAEYPKALESGPDKAGFRVKCIACKMALKNGDIAAAEKIAEEIRVLPCSAEQKPRQLCETGRLFEGKNLFADALTFYNQVMAEYPKALESGPDKAGFYVKYIPCKVALKNGDIAAAKKIAEEIRVLPCSAEQKPSQLYETGRLFEEKAMLSGEERDNAGELFDVCARLYREIVESEYASGNGGYSKLVEIDSKVIEIWRFISVGDIAAAETAIDKLRTDFSTHPKFSNFAILIAEKCTAEGLNIGVEQEAGNKLFCISTALMEKDVLGGISGKNNEGWAYYNEAWVYYFVGQNYNMLTNYPKAVQYFARAMDINPNFNRAWQCLLTMGLCYEKMAKNGDMPKVDALDAAKKSYQMLLEKNPDWPVKQYALRWLEQYGN